MGDNYIGCSDLSSMDSLPGAQAQQRKQTDHSRGIEWAATLEPVSWALTAKNRAVFGDSYTTPESC